MPYDKPSWLSVMSGDIDICYGHMSSVAHHSHFFNAAVYHNYIHILSIDHHFVPSTVAV